MRPRRLLVARLWFEGNRFAPGTHHSGRVPACRMGPRRGRAGGGARHANTSWPRWPTSPRHATIGRCRCRAAPRPGPAGRSTMRCSRPSATSCWPTCSAASPTRCTCRCTAQPSRGDSTRRRRSCCSACARCWATGRWWPASTCMPTSTRPGPALLDFGSAYRTYPHVDLRQTAARVLARLDALCGGERLHGHIAKLGALLPSFRMRSDQAPMAALLARRARAGVGPPGQRPLDPRRLSLCRLAAWRCRRDGLGGRRRHRAGAGGTTMLAALRERQAEFRPRLRTPAAGLDEALRQLQAHPALPVALTDPADNPLSGGGADTPTLLRELLARREQLPREGVVFAYFCDPALVQRAHAGGVGAQLDATLGGRLSTGLRRATGGTGAGAWAQRRQLRQPGADAAGPDACIAARARCSTCRASASSSPAPCCPPTTRPSLRTTASTWPPRGCCA